ncbi:hypothetical protein KIN20_005764 [Parelaphostrongylus tenuis]|uniref:Uncharacterized protein n=1 Tax=Parelaphostrongylus tenuis TaxID=148309 RepID=A0AAD5M0M5_PARTN|nr:hypothetical protein KIN20_005764 [Parelaphostrongylus tenuis]
MEAMLRPSVAVKMGNPYSICDDDDDCKKKTHKQFSSVAYPPIVITRGFTPHARFIFYLTKFSKYRFDAIPTLNSVMLHEYKIIQHLLSRVNDSRRGARVVQQASTRSGKRKTRIMNAMMALLDRRRTSDLKMLQQIRYPEELSKSVADYEKIQVRFLLVSVHLRASFFSSWQYQSIVYSDGQPVARVGKD